MSTPFILKAIRIELIGIRDSVTTSINSLPTKEKIENLIRQLDDMIKDSEKGKENVSR